MFVCAGHSCRPDSRVLKHNCKKSERGLSLFFFQLGGHDGGLGSAGLEVGVAHQVSAWSLLKRALAEVNGNLFSYLITGLPQG